MDCCPLSEPDEVATLYHSCTLRAGCDHRCCECGETIRKGERHQMVKMLFDGKWSSNRTCLLCEEIGDHFSCGGRIIGTLWEELEENFFPDMTAGGPCMDGLSPAAKGRLFEFRTQWLFDAEVERDGARPPQNRPV